MDHDIDEKLVPYPDQNTYVVRANGVLDTWERATPRADPRGGLDIIREDVYLGFYAAGMWALAYTSVAHPVSAREEVPRT